MTSKFSVACSKSLFKTTVFLASGRNYCFKILFMNLCPLSVDAKADSGAHGISGQFDDAEVDHW